jgi:hypothetical protein
VVAKLLVVVALLCQLISTLAQPGVVPFNGARLPSSDGVYGGYGGYYGGYYNYGYGGYYSAGGRVTSSTATCTLGVKDVLTTSGASTLVSLLSAAGEKQKCTAVSAWAIYVSVLCSVRLGTAIMPLHAATLL